MKAFFLSSLAFLLVALGLFSFWTFRTFEEWRAQVSLESWAEETGQALSQIKSAYEMPEGSGTSDLAVKLEAAAATLDTLKGRLGAAVHFENTFFVGAVLGILELTLVFALLGLGLWWFGKRHVFSPLAALTAAVAGWDLKSELPLRESHGTGEVRILTDTLKALQRRLSDYESRIREAEREQVARFLVHQLKNRMTSLSLGAAVLEGNPSGTPAAQRSLRLIRFTLGDMERMLDQFRMVSRFPEPRPTAVSISRLLREVESLLALELALSGPEDMVLEADPLLLKESLINLIQNAREAQGLDNPAPVAVVWSDRSLEVRDTGPGFSAAILSSQGKRWETTKQHGMGLGLAFVRKAAEAHGWNLVLENLSPCGAAVRIQWKIS